MPTKYPRHSIAEKPRVERALRRLRARQVGRRIDFQELLVLGAEEKLRQLEPSEPDHFSLIETFLALRDGEGIDAGAALAHHESGWVRSE